jgi:DNA-directed RNA polymerase subunit beta'
LADTALKTANSGYLTRRLVDVVQDVIITDLDCGTVDGLEVSHYVKAGDIKQRLSERVLGRTVMFDVYDPDTMEVIIPSNTIIDEEVAQKIEEAGLPSLTIRSTLTCQSGQGVCAMCYGRDLARGHLVNVGETVGIIAAQSIGEPGTQLTMRTFHIGGTAAREIERSSITTQHTGQAVLHRVKSVKNQEGVNIVLGKSGQVSIVDDQGREREKYNLPSGARLTVSDGQQIKKDQPLAEWDPFNEPFVTDIEGTVVFSDIIEGKTYQEKVDETTKRATQTIIEYRTTPYRPTLSVVGEDKQPKIRPGTNSAAVFQMPVGAIVMVRDGEAVKAGDVLARKPRESSKTKDIVGGLPRVAELFEVRKPKELAVVSEIDGIVSFGAETKGKRKVLVTPEAGDGKEYLIPRGKHITAQEGDFVEAGEALTEGYPELHDILKIKGEKYLARYLVEEIQDVYRFQGVSINDKHIEIIVRQMLKKVTVIDSGDTSFLIGEQVDKAKFMAENVRIVKEGLRPAVAEPLVLGITQASLSTDSFISAASFQETTKVLTEASLMGKDDSLHGLKENVIVGRLIPAGTGYRRYMEEEISVPDQPERPDKFLEDIDENPLLIERD